jgi:hypothetical protein
MVSCLSIVTELLQNVSSDFSVGGDTIDLLNRIDFRFVGLISVTLAMLLSNVESSLRGIFDIS